MNYDISNLEVLMKEDIKLLKQEFLKIKEMGFIKPLRNGPTGIGYTFETLLNKEEDQECKPDFKSIELKCKLGYSKSALALFNYAPKRNGESATKYIFEKYSHHRYNNKNDFKLFERKVYIKYSILRNNYEFKLKIDYLKQEIILKSYYKGVFLENVCYWDFKTLNEKLQQKLKTIALIQVYPYRREGIIHYKYLKMEIFKLRGFFEFLKLINEDKIYVQFYMKESFSKEGQFILEDHGVAFKIRNKYIEDLFYKVKY